MDVIEFKKEWKRMCDAQETCESCAFNDLSPTCGFDREDTVEYVERMVEVITQWSKTHPVITRQDLFLRQFPNAPKDDDGILSFLPCLFEPSMKIEPQGEELNCDALCRDCKHRYWTEIVGSSQDVNTIVKSKFNLEEYQGNYAMHCDTEGKAKKFLEFLYRCGKSWPSKQSYLEETNWKTYNKDTCYFFNNGTFGSLKRIEEDNYIVLEFDDFDWS